MLSDSSAERRAMKINGRIITSLIMLLVFLFFVSQAIFFTPAARMLRRLLGATVSVLGILLVVAGLMAAVLYWRGLV